MPPITIGRVLALLVLVAAFVLALIGRMDVVEAVMFGGLAVAMLLP